MAQGDVHTVDGGRLPDPENRQMPDVSGEGRIEREVLELSGADAQLVMAILQRWAEYERRRAWLTDRQERQVAQVEGWVQTWGVLTVRTVNSRS
jgi:hypothetical protein